MGPDSTAEVGLTEKDLGTQKIKPPEKSTQPDTEKVKRGGASVLTPFLDEADRDLAEVGATPEEIAEGLDAVQRFVNSQHAENDLDEEEAEEPDLSRPDSEHRALEHVMHESDYIQRARKLFEVAQKYENPESAGFGDLEEILGAEEEDILARQQEYGETVSQMPAEWFALELGSIRSLRETAGNMNIGRRIAQNDEGAIALNEYARNRLFRIENGQDDVLKALDQLDRKKEVLGKNQPGDTGATQETDDKKAHFLRLLEVAGKLIPIYGVFVDKTFNYEAPRKSKKKPQN